MKNEDSLIEIEKKETLLSVLLAKRLLNAPDGAFHNFLSLNIREFEAL